MLAPLRRLKRIEQATYTPRRNAKRALQRRNLVIALMARERYLDSAAARTAGLVSSSRRRSSMKVSAAKRRIISRPSGFDTTRFNMPSMMKNCSISSSPWRTSGSSPPVTRSSALPTSAEDELELALVPSAKDLARPRASPSLRPTNDARRSTRARSTSDPPRSGGSSRRPVESARELVRAALALRQRFPIQDVPERHLAVERRPLGQHPRLWDDFVRASARKHRLGANVLSL